MIGRVGEWDVTMINLASVKAPPELVAPGQGYEQPFDQSLNVLVLRRPGRTVLVDAGTGPCDDWWPGGVGCDLDRSLREAGVKRDAIDLVVLTHLDFDHVGGLLSGKWGDRLEPAFPKVRAVALDVEIDTARGRDPDEQWNAATRAVEVLEGAGRLEAVHDGAEVAPGVRLRFAPGHRPGHAVVEIDGDPPLVFLGDALHHPLHAEHPEWDHAVDSDPETALRTRRRLLEQLASSGARVAATHLFEAGRIERAGESYRWAPG